MAVIYAVENVEDVRGDIEPLLTLHYDELCMSKEAMSLAPDWPRYLELERLNKLLVFTARDDGRLIGYAAFFIDVHIHYKDALIGVNDVIFVHRDYRSTSSTGSQLMDYCEQQLRTIGVVKAIWHIKFKHDWSPILRRRGYQPEDFTMGKIL